ncbi:alpha/beta hydrolase [Streptomyces albospinus]|uniref:Alpha/beta hydrolase n=1 Tax=Streptomyces albospinus TaxID=285515 RepID=A0ABQ2V5V6_9ACTN|nr:alpha/beta hydrolase [Streptomyces albospinus]GGU70526.1 alpha/beta hydrolase [Streptomyces albospinus]
MEVPLIEEALAFTVSTALGEVAVRMTDDHQAADDAPALLLLHANPGDSRDFAAVAPVLAREWRVVTVDWPGFGRSTATDPRQVTADGLVATAEDVLDALAVRHGIRRVCVLGNSVGGYVAARLAQRRADEVAGVVLVDPAGFTPQNAATRFFCRQVMGRQFFARLLVAPLARAYLGGLRTASARATYARARQLRHDTQRLAVHCALWRSFADPRCDLTGPVDRVGAGTTPTLLVWGRRDPVLSAAVDGRRARRALPHAESVLLATGHEPFSERPREFLAEVIPFLRQHATSAWGVAGAAG